MCGLALIIELFADINLQHNEHNDRYNDESVLEGTPSQNTVSCKYNYNDLSFELQKLISRRGPDAFGALSLPMDGNEYEDSCNDLSVTILKNVNAIKNCHFMASVLHIQGGNLAKQPLIDNEGNILMWNGEVIKYLKCTILYTLQIDCTYLTIRFLGESTCL